jgi:hypothetical protein
MCICLFYNDLTAKHLKNIEIMKEFITNFLLAGTEEETEITMNESITGFFKS